jgi:hypothetical protein
MLKQQSREEVLNICSSWVKPAGLILEGEVGTRNGKLIAEEIERPGNAWTGVWTHALLDAAVKRLGAVSEGGKLSYNERVVERIVERVVEKVVEKPADNTAAKAAEQKKRAQAEQAKRAFISSMSTVPTDLDKSDWDNRHKRPEEFADERLKAAKAAGIKAANDTKQVEAQSTATTLIANWGNGLVYAKREQGQNWLQTEWAKLLTTMTPEQALPELRKRIENAWDCAEGRQATREDSMESTITPSAKRPNIV